jgi:hypothetical protein
VLTASAEDTAVGCRMARAAVLPSAEFTRLRYAWCGPATQCANLLLLAPAIDLS